MNRRKFLIGIVSSSIGGATIISSSKANAEVNIQSSIGNVDSTTNTGEIKDIYFPNDKLRFDISWKNMTDLDEPVDLNIYSKLDSDGVYDRIENCTFNFPNEMSGEMSFEDISWVDDNKLQTPLSLIEDNSNLSTDDFKIETEGDKKDFNMYILFDFKHSAFNYKIEVPFTVSITYENKLLSYAAKDDFSGDVLEDRLNQENGEYDSGDTIWENAWLRPDWTPETSGNYSMNDGSISVTETDAEIRAPTPSVNIEDGFRMEIDMRHNRTMGRMNFELGYIDEDGDWNNLYRITNNSGNNNLSGIVYIDGERNNIYDSSDSTSSNTWYNYIISYDKDTWTFKRNGSTMGTASFGTPDKKPTHMRLRNSASDGEGGSWRQLYIDSEY